MGGGQLAWAFLGVQVGNIALFVCLACGLSALVATATNALTILQLAGAGYLLYSGTAQQLPARLSQARGRCL